MLTIHIFNEQNDLSIDERKIKSLIQECFLLASEPASEIGVYFVTDEKMRQLHHEHFNDPSPTDCMTFPIDSKEEEKRYIGDVVICPLTAINYAKEQGLDAYKELTLYIIHTILHLIGFDDIEEKERIEMRKEEKRYLSHLEAKGLIL